MTTKELIRAEIERRKKEMQDKGEQKDLHDSEIIRRCVISTCDDLLSFLDTLPDEPVMDCHDLKEAAEEWIAKQGVSYQTTISADKTIPVLPMKDVSDMGLDYGDKVKIIIVKEDKK